jgi:hypothetical protein
VIGGSWIEAAIASDGSRLSTNTARGRLVGDTPERNADQSQGSARKRDQVAHDEDSTTPPVGVDEIPTKRASQPRRGLAIAAAVIGLLVGVATLVDWIENRLSSSSPRRIDAEVVTLDLTRSVPLNRYLIETQQPQESYTRLELQHRGNVLSVRVRLRGYEGERLALRWALYHAETDAPFGGDNFDQLVSWLSPRNNDHARTTSLWAPIPPASGRFFIRVSLEEEGQILEFDDSEVFQTVGE